MDSKNKKTKTDKVMQKSKKNKSKDNEFRSAMWAREGGKLLPPRSAREVAFRSRMADKISQKRGGAAAELLKAAGGQGKDSRSPALTVEKNGVNSQLVKSQTTTIPVEAYVDYHAVWFLALSPIALAIQRGWLSSTQGFGGAAEAFNAWNYLIQAYYTVMQGSYQNIQASPRWFWETASALNPNGAKFKTGSVQYKWTFFQVLPNPKEVYGGPFAILFGFPTVNTTNGFPVLDPIAAYDPLMGAAALSSLYKFMTDQGLGEVTDGKDDKMLEKDASAFASVFSEWGDTVTVSGGMATTIQNEVKITCPIMSKFAQYQQANNQWRGFQDVRKSSGTSSYIIPRSLEFRSINEYKNKAPPIFKFYNFDEYFLTLSYILGLASERLVQDNATANVPVCPLTSWQVQVILRQAMINRFFNIYAQDLLSTTQDGLSLIPFCMGVNGSSVEATQSMKFPFVFLENIRSATRRTIDVGGKYVVDTLPILCRPNGIPRLGNFTYVSRGGVVTNLYATSVTPEVDVSLIDFSYDNNTKYITATGDALTALTSSWNIYITSLGNALTTLGTLGDEPGISALLTTFNTRHISFNPVQQLLPPPLVNNVIPTPTLPFQRKNSSVKVIGSQIPMRDKVGAPVPIPGESDVYQSYAALVLTSTDPFYSSLWRYTSAFVQPCSFSGITPQFSSSLTLQQVFQIEPYKYPYSDIPQGTPRSALINLDSICLASATLDIKTNLSSPSEAEVELTELAESGRGGFFTSLAGMIGEGLGIPGAREVADIVGAATGL